MRSASTPRKCVSRLTEVKSRVIFNCMDTQVNEGRRIHGLAEQARERGEFLEALKLTDEAMIAYQSAGDSLGFAEIQSSRFLTLRHLYEKTNDCNYLVLAKHAAMSSVEIAENSGQKDALAIPYFNLAKAQETLGELQAAVVSYQKAVQFMQENPPISHNRPGVLADFKCHLHNCEYKAGDKSALERILSALADLEASDEPKYNKDVWMSGTYMRLAENLRVDNLAKAQEYFQKAKEIIDANPELTLRKEQWSKLAASF